MPAPLDSYDSRTALSVGGRNVDIYRLDALEKVSEGRFDLLFTDLEMPRMHGYELIRELRFLPAFRDLPVVVVTSRSSKKHEQQAMALGASAYITKPFTAEVLRVVLDRLTGPVSRGGRP